MKRYLGSCHCGAVKFAILAEPVEMTTCDCTLCAKKNALMIKVHESEFELLEGHTSVSTYSWNTGIAKHHFCSRCGIYTFHRKRVTPDNIGVNVFCLEGFDLNALPVRRTDGKGMSIDPPGQPS